MRRLYPDDQPRLTWLGALLVGAIAGAGLTFFLWAGMFVGAVVGMERAQPALNKPAAGVGLAPDLGGLADAAAGFIVCYAIGAAAGLLVGVAVVWAACRYVLLPLTRGLPGLTRRRG